MRVTGDASNKRVRIKEARLDYLHKQIEEGKEKLEEAMKVIKYLRTTQGTCFDEPKESLDAREYAHGLFRKRVNDIRVAHYTSLVQHQTSVIDTLHKQLLADRLCEIRLRTKKRLELVESIQFVLDLEMLTKEQVDGLVKEAEGDLKKAEKGYGYLMVSGGIAGRYVAAYGAAAIEERNLELRLGQHRDRLVNFCKEVQDRGRVEANEGEWNTHEEEEDTDEEDGGVAIENVYREST
jgi:hypothetical protein